jgi:hypothetical protein
MDFRLIKQKELLAVPSKLEKSLILINFLLSTNLSLVMSVYDTVSLPNLLNIFLKKSACVSFSEKF